MVSFVLSENCSRVMGENLVCCTLSGSIAATDGPASCTNGRPVALHAFLLRSAGGPHSRTLLQRIDLFDGIIYGRIEFLVLLVRDCTRRPYCY